ncbi:hypothetical protein Cob_v002279 [Colletotrichum orbiculare MAFF 240422]|uniref:Uncharacterized protein n=1 Tax=Colletotrichum orbiculare (strain 104-T / ATCC 96160 / CBS 514.97 / LARS 414 / MAFF 240422) TaxID=1213857 RepID=A0A484G311_COLOR|nr:hypothetical protein Cob_v002279 [Colletotrichum orbiculare MAFF 240422]
MLFTRYLRPCVQHLHLRPRTNLPVASDARPSRAVFAVVTNRPLTRLQSLSASGVLHLRLLSPYRYRCVVPCSRFSQPALPCRSPGH